MNITEFEIEKQKIAKEQLKRTTELNRNVETLIESIDHLSTVIGNLQIKLRAREPTRVPFTGEMQI